MNRYFLLCLAITHFIVDFTAYSVDENAQRFPPIESVFGELIQESDDEDLAPFASCFCAMMVTIRTSIREGTTSQIFPQLVIHGFSFAHRFLVLGITDSAKYIYQVLLEKLF